jgi:hypothetical protein
MRKPFYLLCALIISLPMLAGCGTESGSNSLMALLGGGGGVPLPAGSFIKTVIGGGGASSSGNMFGTSAYCRFMNMYSAASIKGSGMITSISFKDYDGSVASSCSHVTIKMGHTGVTTLSSTFADNVEQGKGTLQTVLNDKLFSFAAHSTGEYITLTLDDPFYYNGVDNLIVEVTRTAAFSTAVEVATHTVDSTNYFIVYTTSSGSATGTTSFTNADIKFNFAGGDNRVVAGTTGNNIPFSNNPAYQRVQVLYTSATIEGLGGITGIGFRNYALSTEQTYTVTVRLGYTTLGALSETSQWDDNFNTDTRVTIVDRAVFKVPAGIPAGAYIWLPVTRGLDYNGMNHLLLDINVTAASGDTFITFTPPGATETMIMGSASAPSDASTGMLDIKLRFKGGTADVITAGAYSIWPPFHGIVTGQMQPLYRGAELGINGTIDSIGFRLVNNSAAESYGNFRIILGHSDLDALALGGTYEDNMNNEKTVYSGTVTVPSGLKAGDWVDIPLDTAFKCTPGKNLAVYVLHDAGSAGVENFIQGENNATRYPSRLLGTEDQVSHSPGWVVNILPSIRFGLK